MKFNVVSFGAMNLDRLYRVDHIAKADEESEILDLKESAGGSAANTAVGLARLGVRTGYIGKVAADREGKFLLDAFTKEGVNTDGIIVSKTGRSGTVIGFVDQKGERALYVDPGVNDSLEFGEISPDYATGADFLHLSSFAADRPFEAQKRLVDAVQEVKATLDPGTIYARKGWTELLPLMKRCFAVFPSESELKILTGKGYRGGAEVLLREGVEVVGVKLGKRGCYVTDGEEEYVVEPYKAEVVDSTGAGDAFCAGFLYGLLGGRSLRECGLLGNFVASRVIARTGARNGLPRPRALPL
jgi:ribokinase